MLRSYWQKSAAANERFYESGGVCPLEPLCWFSSV
jgi:hypothetical protein